MYGIWITWLLNECLYTVFIDVYETALIAIVIPLLAWFTSSR